MRQRKVKNLDEKIEALSEYLVREPEKLKGKWAAAFGNDNPIYLEIGCGKGQFLTTHARNNPASNYIGIEGQDSVIIRALEKAQALHLERRNALQMEASADANDKDAGAGNNCLFICSFVQNIGDYFQEGELSGVYLNFSDPWPKDRHRKRRLTYGKRLNSYADVMKADGVIEIKTDNEGLFEFTLEEIEKEGFETLELNRDCHAEVTTEYEDKFMNMGKNINFVKIRR